MFAVLHASKEIIRDSSFYGKSSNIFGEADVAEAIENGKYNVVAMITAHDEEDVYMLTNNINDSWVDGIYADVMPEYKEGCRSTMVGDVFIDTETKERFIVAPAGFDRMN